MSVSWLLLRKSGRQSVARLALTSAAIALGIVLLCYFVAGFNGLVGRGARTPLTTSSFQARNGSSQQSKDQSGVEPLKIANFWLGNLTKWRNQNIDVLSIYGTEKSVSFSHMKTPAPGEYYVSRALAKAIKQHPEDNIIGRFNGSTKYAGIIPDEYVASPDSLMLVRGVSADEVAQANAIAKERHQLPYFSDVYKTDKAAHNGPILDPVTTLILAIGGTILLFPIVTFVAVATQLGGAQREKRYAALRLIGATKGQVTKMLLLESLAAAVVGVVIGLVAFWLLQTPLLEFPMNGLRFWSADIQLSIPQYMLVIGLTLGLTLWVSWRRMRRAQVSPLGVSRSQEKSKKLRAIRIVPLLMGVGIVAWLSSPAGHSWQSQHQEAAIFLILPSLLLIMFGLIMAGSWLTNKIARLLARGARNGSMLIAGKRIAVHSQAVFRSVSGVVLALFAGSFYLTSVSGIEALSDQSIRDNGYSKLKSHTAIVAGQSLPSNMQQVLEKQSYVTQAAATYRLKDGGNALRCQDVARYTEYRCPQSASPEQFAKIIFDKPVVNQVELIDAVDTNAAKDYLVELKTTGATIDQLRSVVGSHTLNTDLVFVVVGEIAKQPVINPLIRNFADLAYIGMGVTLFVAVASLIVSTVGGLLERRRSLYTLRLSGMRLSQLKRLVGFESLVPLLSVSFLSCAIGVWTGAVFTSMFSQSLKPTLTPTYFIVVGTGLVAAIVGIYLVLPMIKRLTSPEANQTE